MEPANNIIPYTSNIIRPLEGVYHIWFSHLASMSIVDSRAVVMNRNMWVHEENIFAIKIAHLEEYVFWVKQI